MKNVPYATSLIVPGKMLHIDEVDKGKKGKEKIENYKKTNCERKLCIQWKRKWIKEKKKRREKEKYIYPHHTKPENKR